MMLLLLRLWRLAALILLYYSSDAEARPSIVVVGSINADTFLPVSRLPTEGENLTLRPRSVPTVDVPGGKGCTQAVAASKLFQGSVLFVGQFGNDAAASVLRKALVDANVDVSYSGKHADLPSGRGGFP